MIRLKIVCYPIYPTDLRLQKKIYDSGSISCRWFKSFWKEQQIRVISPPFPQDGPCVDVIVQVPVVKGDQQGTRRQRRALQQKGLRFIKADPAPAVFGHASALVFKMFRADGDSPGKRLT